MELIENSFDRPSFGQNTTAQSVTILCPLCGTSFIPSLSGTQYCLKCLNASTDITQGITKQGILNFCRFCNRYLRPPWVHCDPESKQLMSLCLRKIRGLQKVKLVDVNFIWTEPHSRRIKLRIKCQKEINQTLVEQSFPVEFVVHYQQCEDCKKEFTPHTWTALVQVRQKVTHKKTFFYLEQLIMKHNAHEKCIKVKEQHEGIDFFYKDKTHALRFIDFLESMFPTKTKSSKQIISEDLNNNTFNTKYTYSVEIPKICKDDLVIVPKKIATQLGGCSQLLLCQKVANMIHLIDPVQMKIIQMDGTKYFALEDKLTFIPAKGNTTEFLVYDAEWAD
mmetsp:Transcript_7/g.10  ORF Transcript_7/g.10 Transcript_7/m.10 type:complete len:335 (+) Transcript_7:58-1062(+)